MKNLVSTRVARKANFSNLFKYSTMPMAALLILMTASCTTITAEEWVLTDENTSPSSISMPYWSTIVFDEEGGNTSDGYLVVEGAGKNEMKKVWNVQTFDFKKGADEKLWVRFRSLGNDVMMVQVTTYDKGERNIELFPVRTKAEHEYRIYSFDNDEAMDWAREHPLMKELEGHMSLSSYTIKFDAYASRNHPEKIVDFMRDIATSVQYDSDAYFELKGFENMDALMEYRDKNVGKVE